MTLSEVKKILHKQTATDIKNALNSMEVILNLSSFYNQFVTLKQGEYHSWQKKKLAGLLPPDQLDLRENQIRYNIVETISMLSEDDIDFEKAKSELSKAPPSPTINEEPNITSKGGGKKSEIYFSYGWGDKNEEGESREKIVNDLYDSLMKDNFNVIRDKMNLEYGGLISGFMDKIGKGDLVVVFISKKYVKSSYCMFELYEIARNCKWDKQIFAQQILPIKIERIDFADPTVLGDYFDYWENEENKWASFIQKRMDQVSKGQLTRYDNTKKINQNFGQLADWLADINSSTISLLSENEFSLVKETIVSRIGK